MALIHFAELPAVSGKLGVITLTHSQALNALTLEMVNAMLYQLNEWAHQPEIFAVVLQSDSPRAFCAGGDLRALYEARGHFSEQLRFFEKEYQSNYVIGTYPKPIVALLQGIVMGGGVGTAVYASHRVACENLCFAMPETGIGLFPDVGSSYFFNKMPGFLGYYCALTGARLNVADAAYAGVIDCVVSSNHYPEIIQALTEEHISASFAHQAISELLANFTVQADCSMYQEKQDLIDGIFSGDDVSHIMNDLRHDDCAWSQAVLVHLQQKSPMSLLVTLEGLKRAQRKDLSFCLKQDFFRIQSFLQRDDLYEGIRAVIIDKDMAPVWQPSTLDAVAEDQIASCFDQAGKAVLDL